MHSKGNLMLLLLISQGYLEAAKLMCMHAAKSVFFRLKNIGLLFILGYSIKSISW